MVLYLLSRGRVVVAWCFAALYRSEQGSAGVAQEVLERKEEGGAGKEETWAGLLVTAQQLHSQGDAPVPSPRQDADESGVERRLEQVLLVDIVVAVAREDLEVGESNHTHRDRWELVN